MSTFQVHVFKEFSTVIEVEADSVEEALRKYDAGDFGTYPDWEESGDEYASAITDPDGVETPLQDGELP